MGLPSHGKDVRQTLAVELWSRRTQGPGWIRQKFTRDSPHTMALIVTVMFATTGKIRGDWFRQTILLGASFVVVVETGVANFNSGVPQMERA